MKKLLIVFCVLFGAAVATQAQDTTSTKAQDTTFTQDQPTQDDQPVQESEQYRTDDQDQEDKDRKEIAVSELPATITDKLSGQDYNGWTISKAFKKEKDGETMYAVELKQGDEMKKVKFDAQGNIIKEKDKKDPDQK